MKNSWCFLLGFHKFNYFSTSENYYQNYYFEYIIQINKIKLILTTII